MKIFLQDCKTAKFMRCDSVWSLNIGEALDFLSVKRAVSFGMKELKDAFQVVRSESNGRPGAVVIAISNLLWPEGSQQALSISLTTVMPEPGLVREFSLSPEIVLGTEQKNPKSSEHPIAPPRIPAYFLEHEQQNYQPVK